MNAWRMGWASVCANAVPMIVLWAVVGALVLAFYQVPTVAGWLAPLARWQTESGWLAAFLNRVFFAGVVPGVFLLTVRRIRPRRPLSVALAQSLWCGVWGPVCAAFFALQSALFGDGADLLTLALKTAVDQFVWTVLVVAPANGVFFLWMGCDFSLARMRRAWPAGFFRELVLPLLLPNWIIWIPVVALVYAFPLPLQVQVSGIALSVSMLLSLFIGRQVGRKERR